MAEIIGSGKAFGREAARLQAESVVADQMVRTGRPRSDFVIVYSGGYSIEWEVKVKESE